MIHWAALSLPGQHRGNPWEWHQSGRESNPSWRAWRSAPTLRRSTSSSKSGQSACTAGQTGRYPFQVRAYDPFSVVRFSSEIDHREVTKLLKMYTRENGAWFKGKNPCLTLSSDTGSGSLHGLCGLLGCLLSLGVLHSRLLGSRGLKNKKKIIFVQARNKYLCLYT